MSIIFIIFVFIRFRLTQKSSDLQIQIQPYTTQTELIELLIIFKREECYYAIHLGIGTLPLQKNDLTKKTTLPFLNNCIQFTINK